MASILGSAWEFRQLGPPNKTITLNDYQAPFGRLRKNAVIETEFELRMAEVRYAGLRVPTRQHFGDKESDIVLKGRWSDKFLGKNGANQLAVQVKQFIADAVVCTVSWGQVCAYVGLPAKLRIGREDSQNMTWEITVLVDEDKALTSFVPNIDDLRTRSPVSQLAQVNEDLSNFMLVAPDPDLLANLSPAFLDDLASLVNRLRNATAEFYTATQYLQDWTSATGEQLQRAIGAVSQLSSAVENVQGAVNTASIDGIIFARTADTDYEWAEYASTSDYYAESVLYDLAQMQRQAQLAQQGGQGQVTTVAQGGDTWESISDRVYGDPDGASTLRDANGITYGQLPTPGTSYVVPLNSQG